MSGIPSEKEDVSPSFWALKPWWCQPWTIITTGVTLPAASWLLLQHWWISAPIAAGVAVWWWLFLVAVPRTYSEQLKPPGQR